MRSASVPGSAPRVLLVGFSTRNKYFGDLFYASIHKFRNGFIRAGSHVVWFSDRDTADFATPCASGISAGRSPMPSSSI